MKFASCNFYFILFVNFYHVSRSNSEFLTTLQDLYDNVVLCDKGTVLTKVFKVTVQLSAV